MLRFFLSLSLCAPLLFSALLCHADDAVIVAVEEDIPADYRRFLNGRNPIDIHAYNTEGARRDIIELTLLMQALHLGGFKKPVELRTDSSYLRVLRGVTNGRYISTGALAWKSDLDAMQPALNISNALIKEGEFVVGLYSTQQNLKYLSKLKPARLNQLNTVTNSQWKSDIQTLKDLGFSHITYSPSWPNIARMIEAGRAEMTMAPFQTTNKMVIDVEGVRLYPIKGIKVAISGSRHWGVSRQHPDGEAFYQALERGIKILESKGTIARAYRECGFFHPDVAHWPLLNGLTEHP